MDNANVSTADKRPLVGWRRVSSGLVDTWLVDHPEVRNPGSPSIEAFAAVDQLSQQAGFGPVRFPADLPAEVRAAMEPPIRTMARVARNSRRW